MESVRHTRPIVIGLIVGLVIGVAIAVIVYFWQKSKAEKSLKTERQNLNNEFSKRMDELINKYLEKEKEEE